MIIFASLFERYWTSLLNQFVRMRFSTNMYFVSLCMRMYVQRKVRVVRQAAENDGGFRRLPRIRRRPIQRLPVHGP